MYAQRKCVNDKLQEIENLQELSFDELRDTHNKLWNDCEDDFRVISCGKPGKNIDFDYCGKEDFYLE